jgi:hypothetical protein
LIHLSRHVTIVCIVSKHRVTCDGTSTVVARWLPLHDQIISVGTLLNSHGCLHSTWNIANVESEFVACLTESVKVDSNHSVGHVRPNLQVFMSIEMSSRLVLCIENRGKVLTAEISGLQDVASDW